MKRLFLLFIILALSCEKQVEGPEIEVDRSQISPDDDGFWESSPWNVTSQEHEFIHIPGGTTLYLKHGLGKVPRIIQTYVSFSTTPDYQMPAAGNASEVWEATEDTIVIHNGTGADFYYRFVLY